MQMRVAADLTQMLQVKEHLREIVMALICKGHQIEHPTNSRPPLKTETKMVHLRTALAALANKGHLDQAVLAQVESVVP